MKKTVIFGAGQIGSMVARLLGGEFELLCFADNMEKKQGSYISGVPVLSPLKALELNPELVFLGVFDEERSRAMTQQLHALGYNGEILTAEPLKLFDARAAVMRLLAEQINAIGIPGSVAELGVYKGEFARLISAAFPERTIHLFDTFCGFDGKDVAVEQTNGFSKAAEGDFSETSVDAVKSLMPYPENTVFHKGYFPDTFDCGDEKFVFVSIDADLYAPTAAALPLFWDRLACGGVLMIHDVNSTQFCGAGKAVNEFCMDRYLFPIPVCDMHGTVILRKPA